jgi:hypothetical protein
LDAEPKLEGEAGIDSSSSSILIPRLLVLSFLAVFLSIGFSTIDEDEDVAIVVATKLLHDRIGAAAAIFLSVYLSMIANFAFAYF